MFSGSCHRVTAFAQLSQSVFMPDQLLDGLWGHGDLVLEQIQRHFTEGIDLFSIGMR